MPGMANITVKNVANADVVFAVSTPSAGDRSPAVWRQNAVSGIIGHRPVLTVLTRDNNAKNARHLSVSMRWPVTATVDGRVAVVGTIPMNLEVVLPTTIDSSNCTEAFTQFGNLLVSDLLRGVASEGYAPA